MRKLIRAALAAAALFIVALPALAQSRFVTPNEQFLDGSGVPYAGGKLFFYQSGTSTPLNTYSDQGLTIPNANPVVLDSAGRSISVFMLAQAYKVVLQDKNGVQVWTADPVAPGASSNYTAGYTGSVTETVQKKLDQLPTIADFGAVCDGGTSTAAAFRLSLTALNYAIVPPGPNACLVEATVTVGANQIVAGLPGARVTTSIANGTSVLQITGSGGVVQDLDLNLNGATATLVSAIGGITRPVIRRNRLHGAGTGFYVSFVGDTGNAGTPLMIGAVLEDNVADQADNALLGGGSAFLFQAVQDFRASRNRCVNDTGFCLETLWSSGVIDGHYAYRPDYGSAVVSSSTTVPFTVARKVGRCGLQDNNVPVTIGSGGYALAGCDASTTALSATIPGGSVGHTITLVAYAGAEAMSINSGSGPITVNDPQIDGAGDNGITIGADYHFNGSAWVAVSSGSIVYADDPFEIAIHHPTVANTINAGIGWDLICSNLHVDDFNISRFSRGATDPAAFPAAIVLTYGQPNSQCNSIVGPGLIDHTTGCGNVGGCGKYGVMVNGTPVETSAGQYEKQVQIGSIIYRDSSANPLLQQHFLSAIVNVPSSNIALTARGYRPYPAQPDFDTLFSVCPATGVPTASVFFAYAGTACSDAVTKIGGNNSLEITAGNSVTITLNAETSGQGLTFGKIACLAVWINPGTGATSLTGPTVTLASPVSGSSKVGPIAITGTGWQLKRFCVSWQGLAFPLTTITFAVPGGGNTSRVQYPFLEIQDID